MAPSLLLLLLLLLLLFIISINVQTSKMSNVVHVYAIVAIIIVIKSNEPYPQSRHDIKMAALWGDNVQRAYGEVNVSLCYYYFFYFH